MAKEGPRKGKMISNPMTIGPPDNRVKAKTSSIKSKAKKEYLEKLKRKGIDA